MKWLELLNMEYGECVVLGGGDRSLLMVDCGSVSQKLREGAVPLDAWLETIAARYEPAMERWFLLTHFHRDHLSGFQKLLESREGYFSRVFLPRAPVDSHGVPLLLEYALFAYLFAQPQSDAFQVNTWCVKAFRTLEQRLGQDRIFTLGAGDSFHFDGVEYQVLWPRVESYPFEPELAAAVEALNVLFASPFQPGCVKRFLEKKEEFLALYVKCGEAFAAPSRALPEKRRAYLEHLNRVLEDLENLREELGALPQAHDVREALENPLNAGAYTNGVNGASVVFHNGRKGGPSEQDNSRALRTGGNHGPAPRWVLYSKGAPPRHGQRLQQPVLGHERRPHPHQQRGVPCRGRHRPGVHRPGGLGVRHCTSTGACKWFRASQGCCNRLAYCYDQQGGPGLVIKCPEAANAKNVGCAIRVVGPHRPAGLPV